MISAYEFNKACDRYSEMNREMWDIHSNIMSTKAQFDAGMQRLRAAGDAMRAACALGPVGAIGCLDGTHDCVAARRVDR